MRKLVIGDIHGGYKGLIQVLTMANFDYDNDLLISLGDVTDGWSEVAECIEELMKINNLIVIKGNHDEWTERYLKHTLANGSDMYSSLWYDQGGEATYNSYKKHPELVDKHLKYIEDAKTYYVDEENRIFMHAGFDPTIALDKQPFLDYGQNKNENAMFYWDRKFWSFMVSKSKFGHVEPWKEYKEIYIGHTPTITQFEEGTPVNIGNVWDMDTGATYSGKLSLMDIETKELFQSDPLYTLYPNEKGRNGKFLTKK